MPKKRIIQKYKGLCRMSTKLLSMTDTVVETTEIETCAVGYKDGRVELLLGPLFLNCKDDKARQHMLRHECFHIMLDHHARQGERKSDVWNRVTDAAIHAGGAVDWQLIDKACDIETITYERLGIPTMPPELAYDLLTGPSPVGPGPGPGPGPFGGDGPAGQPGKGGCGRGKVKDKSDTDEKSKAKEAEVVAEVLQSWEAEVEESGYEGHFDNLSGVSETQQAGMGRGSGRERPEIYKVPIWVVEVLDRLLERHNAKLDRDRTWTREHRYIESGLLPGQKRSKGWEGVWCIDASGSIDHEAVNQMMNAAVQTPELASSMVAVFDGGMVHDELIPVHDVAAIQEAIGNAGGGTSIKQTAQQVDELAGENTPKVWLTDAYSSDGLPEKSDDELWVMFGYRGIKVVDYPTGRRV